MKLLLASKSPARREMLERAGVPFALCSADFDEERAKAVLRAAGTDARASAAALARMKAEAAGEPGALVLGADQTLERDDGSMLDKPGSREEAAEQLRSLRCRVHRLHSGAALAEGGRETWSCVETVVLRVRGFSEDFLADYLDAEYDAVRYNVGGYRIEGLGVQLFEAIEGSHFAILGLPLLPLLAHLRDRGALAS